jgi:hypothetical protein
LYEAKVHYKDQLLEYWMVHLPFFDFDVIDFKESIFFTGPLNGKEYVRVNSLSEYKNAGHMMPSKLVLNEKFDKSLDFFSLRTGGMFVSERLRDEFLKRCLTGVEFDPAFGEWANSITPTIMIAADSSAQKQSGTGHE